MIECIFTIDYEIYGNGQGSLRELVYEPAQKLKDIFEQHNVRFVNFVEAAEFEMIEKHRTDPAIDLVTRQIKELHTSGFETGLHLHPQWYNARYDDEKWELDYREYNLCTLPRERIEKIIGRSLNWLRNVLDVPSFTPLSFRAGNWLFQPSKTAAGVLVNHGFKIDSSVFKGGFLAKHNLDYRKALKNGYYWKFTDDVNIPDPEGKLIEIPTYTKMVLPWKMVTKKRISLEQHAPSARSGLKSKLNRVSDLMRLRYPLKLDFCRMSFDELTDMVDNIISEDKKNSDLYKPIVLIGHTKDLTDFKTVESFLLYLKGREISLSTFEKSLSKLTFQS